MNGYTIPSYLQLQRLNVPNPCSPLYIFYYVLSLNCDTDSAPKYCTIDSILQYLNINSISILFIRLLQTNIKLYFFFLLKVIILAFNSYKSIIKRNIRITLLLCQSLSLVINLFQS